MVITFIMAAMSHTKSYIKTWQMEPIGIAQVVALTPKDVAIKFYDDRVEEIDYDFPTDYVAISMETYSAQRSYEIIEEYHKRGKKVIAGGFHPTLMTDEVLEHADSVIVGEAENVWREVIEDCRTKSLKKIYKSKIRPDLSGIFPDRSIFKNKNYMPIALIESSRGCRFDCQFCSIAAFYQKSCNYRPIEDVVKEVRESTNKTVFFIDDNIGSDVERAKELFRQLAPLKIKWFSQISTSSLDDEIVGLMRKSGCLGVLIGFESFNKANLAQMNKTWNVGMERYEKILNRLTKNKIFVYGTFIFGYDEDDEGSFKEALQFAIKNNLVLAAFNHLMPFPGTPVYESMRSRLKYDKWWLGNQCKFGDVVFEPKRVSAERLSELCYVYKKKFYSFPMMLKRAWGLRWCLLSHLGMMGDFFKYNWICNKETTQRRGFKIGKD
ncbi:MAG: B12-binding domain-containing radical SAM protein [Candidatus Omnitrophica bacterium]|nr:B12-binding domain-containing radical SAM protein [Candidatus Omnitrophota bacterium]